MEEHRTYTTMFHIFPTFGKDDDAERLADLAGKINYARSRSDFAEFLYDRCMDTTTMTNIMDEFDFDWEDYELMPRHGWISQFELSNDSLDFGIAVPEGKIPPVEIFEAICKYDYREKLSVSYYCFSPDCNIFVNSDPLGGHMKTRAWINVPSVDGLFSTSPIRLGVHFDSVEDAVNAFNSKFNTELSTPDQCKEYLRENKIEGRFEVYSDHFLNPVSEHENAGFDDADSHGKADSAGVQFISYDGAYPNYCDGTLTIKVNGKVWRLNNCLISGGSTACDDDGDYIIKGPWVVGVIPIALEPFREKIQNCVRDHVPQGCCGGCI